MCFAPKNNDPDHPSSSSPPRRRQDQVAELLRNLPAAESLNRDQTLFQVPLTLPDGTATHVRVSLPPSFPGAPPVLSLGARVAHTWVDAGGRLTTPELAGWAPPASRLATAVGEAVAALSSPGGGPPPRAPAPPPALPSAFPELEAASNADLEKWVTDGGAFGELASRVAARIARERGGKGGAPSTATPSASALDTAKATLAKETVLAELRNQVAVIRSSEYDDAAAAAAAAAARQAAVSAAIAPTALVSSLAAAAADADAASSRAYDAFLAGGAGKVDAFIKEYVAMRTDVHRLELKKEAAKATLL